MLAPGLELCDLHIHVGAAVAPHILWSIAHEQGFKLPVQTYWEFRDLVTADPKRVTSLDDYLAILHTYTEKIQSSPAAIERSVGNIRAASLPELNGYLDVGVTHMITGVGGPDWDLSLLPKLVEWRDRHSS